MSPEHPQLVLAILDIAPWHLLIILIIALLIFGRRLPDIMRGLGSSMKEFRKGMHEDPPVPPASAPPPAASSAPALPATPAAGPQSAQQR